ncbi:hypothetical protein NQ318_022995 [Aromia moschata]|uniref:Uncharacterized protein n=1 Tax=Aromia moschata TaxID=1265417 RepID=A0AAV8YDC8_9CUCU|nr:hypothetical protein NQ318_022995 [Aromia moschata]
MSQLNEKVNKRALGEPVTGPVLQAKTKQFHASLNVDSIFGWIAPFSLIGTRMCTQRKEKKF